MSTLPSVVVFGSAWSGFAALALSMSRYSRRSSTDAAEPSDGKRLAIRAAGWSALLISVVACLAWNGGALGATLWFGLATLAAVTVTLVVTYWPRQLGHAALGWSAIAAIGLLTYACT